MENKKSKLLPAVSGFAIGAVNSLLGAGGGMIAVPILKKLGFDQKEAQCNAIAVILPITVLSAGLYIYKGYADISTALPYIPGGIVGAILGTIILKKISPKWLKRIFGGFMVYAGIRLLFK
ncbi:MAG: sulfite exporter TauE/SafE family protein [Clostridia bacterium]|nr:sulfite exporter TauE/SafE family protein [Clostridia bacterium]